MRQKNLPHNPEVAGSNPVSASEKEIQEKNLVSFFMPCDRRVPGAAVPTAAGGRRRKVMQARNREFRRQNAERESGRPDFEVGKAGSNPVSASEKEIQEKILYLFLCPATDGFPGLQHRPLPVAEEGR